MRILNCILTFAALMGALATPHARGADVLYVGDAGDNTIKAFDASDGTFLSVSDGPGVSGLAGPRRIIVRGSELLVVNQNVDQPVPGEVLSSMPPRGCFWAPSSTLRTRMPPSRRSAWSSVRTTNSTSET